MSVFQRSVRYSVPLAMIVSCWTVHTVGSAAWAGEPDPPGRRPRISCGRARSLASLPRGHRIPRPDRASLESLADTDVLHYVLDIEVSNLDPVLNTCDIVGSNVMTIRSKSATLNEFTIRLRNQYTIPNAYVNGSTPVTVTTTSETTRVVTLDRTYTMDEVFTLTIEYQGNSVYLPETGSTITVDTQPDGTPVVATLSQPYFAYTWWPVTTP